VIGLNQGPRDKGIEAEVGEEVGEMVSGKTETSERAEVTKSGLSQEENGGTILHRMEQL